MNNKLQRLFTPNASRFLHCTRQNFSFRKPSPNHQQFAHHFNQQQRLKTSQTDTVLYLSSTIIFLVGLTYAAVPLYRLVCQATGLGGTVKIAETTELDVEKMRPRRDTRRIKVSFNADTSASMKWKFSPQQHSVYVHPGETSLVFYTAKNPTDEDIIGISAYNVVPYKAGAYFNKIQCFCFEEQKLKAQESVDMPVFFFIDPEFDNDPLMDDVREITLSYTFFNARQGVSYYPGTSTATNDNGLLAKHDREKQTV